MLELLAAIIFHVLKAEFLLCGAYFLRQSSRNGDRPSRQRGISRAIFPTGGQFRATGDKITLEIYDTPPKGKFERRMYVRSPC